MTSQGSSTTMSKEERYALMEKFLGFPPKEFLEDVYRAGEDYICDSIDQIEKEFLSLGEQIHQKSSKQSTGRQRSTTATTTTTTAGPTDSQLHEEIAQGMEKLWNILLSPYEHVGDMFEVYCLKNIFAWPQHIPLSKPAGSGRMYTVQEEKTIDNRISKLEEAIMKERRRKRTLLHIRDLYHKRLPQAETASIALDSMANEMLSKGIFASASSTSTSTSSSATNATNYSTKDTAFTDFLERGTRLKALCDRLAAASPDIAQQMIEVTENDDENFLASSSSSSSSENTDPPSLSNGIRSHRKLSTTKSTEASTTTVLSSSNPNNNATNLLLQKFDQSITSLGGGTTSRADEIRVRDSSRT